MNRSWLVPLCALMLSLACDGTEPTDAGPEPVDTGPGTDAGGALDVEIPGLDGEVEVIVDDRGMPHIYASTVHDLMVVEGYLMARDRFVQMELLRRNTVGRLAEVLGALSSATVDSDRAQRFFQFERQGQAIYDSLAADDHTRLVAEAFVQGINHYIDTVVDDDGYLPPRGHELFNVIRVNENFGHWQPRDVFALARFQAWNLAYGAAQDINNTRALQGVRDAFDPDGADARMVARAGIFGDFWSTVQARRSYTRDGFNDGTTMAFLPPITRPIGPGPIGELSMASVRGAGEFFDRLQQNPYMARNEHYGSNSWVVHGDHTASGNTILSNDPHLALFAPPVWWYVHLNTARMGGEDLIDAEGIAFAGLPGVVLGFNQKLAWSATTAAYDVTDVYAETVTFRNDGTPAEPRWVPVSVTFDGAQVDLTTIDEEILVASGAPVTQRFYVVPHHGRIIPTSLAEPVVADPPAGMTAEGRGMSVRYTGDDVSNELAFFIGLLTAESVNDAFTAADAFQVGIQNFSFADTAGNIGWTTSGRIPQRACNFWLNASGVPNDAVAPAFVMPGTGGYEWGADLDPAFVPHDQNPARGYIATANQDNVGVTEDGNPCNDGHYLGAAFAVGYRMGRIVERLDAMTAAGGITPDDMVALQHETTSQLGQGMRDAIVASLEHALGDPSDDSALAAVMTAAGADGAEDLMAARDRLAAWDFSTPHGVGATDSAEIANSVATTLFNVTLTQLSQLTFDDEEALIGRSMGSSQTARMLEWSLASAADQMALPLYTYAASYGGIADWNDTVVWDDLATAEVTETRDERVVSAVLAAIAWLEGDLGTDWDAWRWGQLHTLRFQQLVTPVADRGVVSIPPRDSSELPFGYPRDGDFGAVDVLNYSLSDPDIRHGVNSGPRGGPSQRLVVEMTPSGPVARNALPGGQAEDPDSPHHADEAAHWIANEQPPLYFTRDDVEAHSEATMRFAPGN